MKKHYRVGDIVKVDDNGFCIQGKIKSIERTSTNEYYYIVEDYNERWTRTHESNVSFIACCEKR